MTELEVLRTAFERHWGRPPAWIVRAPGRVNVIGEHTDYNEGFVLPMAIEREVRIAAAPNDSVRLRLRSSAVDEAATIELSEPVRAASAGDWSNYPRGVVAGFIERGIGLGGLDLLIDSSVPLGGGLSSSAALAVATATLLEASAGERLEPLEKVRLCQEAEHRFAGVPCGIMDPYVVSLAVRDHLLLLDCQSCQARMIEFSDPAVSVLIVATNVKHSLAASEYPLRRRQCEAAARMLGVPSLRAVSERQFARAAAQLDALSLKRARHVVSENARTQQAVAAISAGRWSEAGQLMYRSHESLRTDFEVSSPELDRIVEICTAIGEGGGVFGARMTGGGFGGCAVVLVRTEAAPSVTARLSTGYAQHFGAPPASFVSRAAAGAGVLQA
ncbi:MAG: galactokinase, partial [Sinobacteraceae bacterium]|nr:galactokinase [Nevskiaceae bacterium]MBV9316144.1 galactokinase [Gammaproteobacteria bacterium]